MPIFMSSLYVCCLSLSLSFSLGIKFLLLTFNCRCLSQMDSTLMLAQRAVSFLEVRNNASLSQKHSSEIPKSCKPFPYFPCAYFFPSRPTDLLRTCINSDPSHYPLC